MATLHSIIKQLREAKGLTQKQLADILGVKFQSLQQWENGKGSPRPQRLPALAQALDVTVDELVSGNLKEAKEGVILTGNVKSIIGNIPNLYVQTPFLSAKAQADIPKMIADNLELQLDESYPVFTPYVVLDDRHVVIEVVGEQMEPEIKSGAIVLAERIEKQDYKYESGGVYAIWYANRFAVRRIKSNGISEGQKLTLWSDNERYGQVIINENDIKGMWKVTIKLNEPVR